MKELIQTQFQVSKKVKNKQGPYKYVFILLTIKPNRSFKRTAFIIYFENFITHVSKLIFVKLFFSFNFLL